MVNDNHEVQEEISSKNLHQTLIPSVGYKTILWWEFSKWLFACTWWWVLSPLTQRLQTRLCIIYVIMIYVIKEKINKLKQQYEKRMLIHFFFIIPAIPPRRQRSKDSRGICRFLAGFGGDFLLFPSLPIPAWTPPSPLQIPAPLLFSTRASGYCFHGTWQQRLLFSLWCMPPGLVMWPRANNYFGNAKSACQY